MIRRPPRSTQGVSSAASDVYKRQVLKLLVVMEVMEVMEVMLAEVLAMLVTMVTEAMVAMVVMLMPMACGAVKNLCSNLQWTPSTPKRLPVIVEILVLKVQTAAVVQPVLTDRRARRPKPMVCMLIMAL